MFSIDIYGDSQLVINQMVGIWLTNSDKLYYPYFKEAKLKNNLLGGRQKYICIPREKNQVCDRLSKAEFVKRNIKINDYNKY